MNIIVRSDALDLGAFVPPGPAQLAYLDPPFAVGVSFRARRTDGSVSHRATGPVAYEDRWESVDAYATWLEARLAATRELLGDDGTLWLHLDHRAVHEAKIACDRVFGRGRFLGEIIWLPGNGSKSRQGPGMTHQTLLVYAKTDDYVWNASDPCLREPYAETSQQMHFRNCDGDGRHYRDRTIKGKTYRYYADEGRARGSVWSDCPAMTANTPLLREATGYPTQKPKKLLDRIVRASSSPGALVIDPFFGSGTTLVAAAEAGRRFAGSDIGELAFDVTTKRLEAAKIAFKTAASERGALTART